jgi:RimJ/RimL family protein N-acetyltransferase
MRKKVKTIIETERLVLREITLDDKEELFKLHSNPAVQFYTGEPIVETIEEIEKAILGRINDYKKYGYGRWATFLKNDMQFVGWAGLAYLDEFDEIDLGYRFLPEYWGLGIATEVSRAILTYGFDFLKLSKIVAIAMKENKASIKVREKVGMEFENIAPSELGSKDAIWYWCDKKLLSKNNTV